MVVVGGNGIGGLDEAVCTSLCANALGRGMNQSLLSSLMVK